MDLCAIKLSNLIEFTQFQVIFLAEPHGMGCEELRILVHVSKNEENGWLKVRCGFRIVFTQTFKFSK